MERPEYIGVARACDADTVGRHLYLLELDDLAALPDDLQLHGTHFACGLLLDATSMATGTLGRMAVALLEQGMVYACAWGPDCERVHDIIDEEIVGGGPRIPRFDGLIMTSWHAAEPLDEGLWFLLNCACPADRFEAGCTSTLVVSSGHPAWAARARQVLRAAVG